MITTAYSIHNYCHTASPTSISYIVVSVFVFTFLFFCRFQCVFSFSFTNYPGPPRLVLLPAEPGDLGLIVFVVNKKNNEGVVPEASDCYYTAVSPTELQVFI